jgi:uncharacterized protein (DUF362 family)/Pyruvate/2-oxoacid:ferredoxin oxidoreductase delta subunit
MKSKVGVIACEDYNQKNLELKILKLFEYLGGVREFISNQDRVLIKPNFLMAKEAEKCVTTHPNFILSVVKIMKEFTSKEIVVADSPSIHSIQSVAQKLGIDSELSKLGVRLLQFKNSKLTNTRDAFANNIFKKIEIAQELNDFDKIINLPKIKTHGQIILTCAVKNMFGCVVGMKKAKWHLSAGINYDYFASLLLTIYKTVNPIINIVDGIMAMEGNGPASGTPRRIGVILAGSDGISIDRIVCEILGIDPNFVRTIFVAKNKAIGNTELPDIELVGDNIAKFKINDFKLPRLTSLYGGKKNFLRNYLKNAFDTKPIIDKKVCNLCKICIKHCPPEIMSLDYDAQYIKINYDNCIRCYCCQEVCQQGAITIKEGYLQKLGSNIKKLFN